MLEKASLGTTLHGNETRRGCPRFDQSAVMLDEKRRGRSPSGFLARERGETRWRNVQIRMDMLWYSRLAVCLLMLVDSSPNSKSIAHRFSKYDYLVSPWISSRMNIWLNRAMEPIPKHYTNTYNCNTLRRGWSRRIEILRFDSEVQATQRYA